MYDLGDLRKTTLRKYITETTDLYNCGERTPKPQVQSETAIISKEH